MSVVLFEHNQSAYRAVLHLLAETGKAAVIHPTGTGKSFIALKLCEDYPEKRICWLSSSEHIFKTQLENWQSAGAEFPQNIQFFTYAKLMMMQREEIEQICPDFIILDEFHRCGAQMWGEGVQRLLQQYPKIPMLGLSATNIRYLDNQRDMADELFDGHVASEISLGEAIVRGILNPPKYVLSIFSYQKDLEQYERRVRKAKNKAVRDTAERYLEALRRALEKAEGLDVVFSKHMSDDPHGKYIVFCANVEHLHEMIEHVPEWFDKVDKKAHVYSVYSENPEMSKEFTAFKEDTSEHLKLLFCVDMLNEGIHVEDISGVILLRPTVSPIIYKQQIGRALSANKKKHAVIFDIVCNIENLYSIGAVEEEMQIAMTYYRTHGMKDVIVNRKFHVIDEVRNCVELFNQLNSTLSASWDLMYSAARQYYKVHGDLEVPKRYLTVEGFSLGQWLNTQRRVYAGKISGVLTEEQVEKLNAIGMRWQGIRDVNWDNNYAVAKAYFEEFGNLVVGVNDGEYQGVNLGKWLAQLRFYRKNKIQSDYMKEERISALDKIGMVWDVPNYLWEQNYYAAVQYHQEHGNLDVPSSYVTKDGIRLGTWLNNMREIRKGEQRLSEQQIQKLDELGMIWESKREATWNTFYEAAKKYQREHGDLNVPTSYITEDKEQLRLGKWICYQREKYGKKRMLLNGNDGESTENETTENETTGSEIIESEIIRNELTRNTTVKSESIRSKAVKSETIKNETIKNEAVRIAKLDAIGMVWETEDPWERKFQLVKKYYEEHGNLNMEADYVVDGIWLARWLSEQIARMNESEVQTINKKQGEENKEREEKKKTKTAKTTKITKKTEAKMKTLTKASTKTLTEKQVAQLESLGIQRNVSRFDIAWQQQYEEVHEFYRKNGNIRLPKHYVGTNGKKLDLWLFRQRDKWKKGLLDEKQTALLNNLGMDWETTDPWQIGYEHAREYYENYNDLYVKSNYVCEDGYKLGKWIQNQRSAYTGTAKRTLSIEEIHQLDAIGMIWSANELKWRSVYEEVKQYRQEYGNFSIPHGFRGESGVDLAGWLDTQKYAKREKKLSAEKEKLLDEIGIDWLLPAERKWEDAYTLAVLYYQKNGNLQIPSTYQTENGYCLGRWLKNQQKNREKLNAKQIEKLDAIGAGDAYSTLATVPSSFHRIKQRNG